MNPLSIVHIASGDRWAGAEVQLFTLLSTLQQTTDHQLHAILLNDGELAQKLRATGIDTRVIDESQYNSLAILGELIRTLKQLQPDVVHTHRSKENILGAIANRLTVKAKCLRTVHGAAEYQVSGLRAIIPWLDHWVGRHLQQHIIAVSSELADKLASDYPREKIVVIENGIDVEATRQLASEGKHLVDFAPNKTHIGLIGRLEPVKRGDIFLDMAKQLVTEHPERDWQFHIFGDGSQTEPLKNQCSQLGLDDCVTFHGHTAQIHPYIQALDAVVMCSDHEGLPMTALECVALQTLLIAHCTGGLVQILAAAAQVKQHNASGYAERVARFTAHDHAKERGKILAENSRRIVTSEKNAEAIGKLYNVTKAS